MFGNELISI